jgi:hypothetical protein
VSTNNASPITTATARERLVVSTMHLLEGRLTWKGSRGSQLLRRSSPQRRDRQYHACDRYRHVGVYTQQNVAGSPIADQITGTAGRRQDRDVASISTPAAKIVAGHGTPNVGILTG